MEVYWNIIFLSFCLEHKLKIQLNMKAGFAKKYNGILVFIHRPTYFIPIDKEQNPVWEH